MFVIHTEVGDREVTVGPFETSAAACGWAADNAPNTFWLLRRFLSPQEFADLKAKHG